jgi:putative lipoic acid-binding regulatory protein
VDPAKVFGRPSRKGKYISANIFVMLENGDEVIAVYSALKSDKRVVWYL